MAGGEIMNRIHNGQSYSLVGSVPHTRRDGVVMSEVTLKPDIRRSQ
jgi:hypothetical protein